MAVERDNYIFFQNHFPVYGETRIPSHSGAVLHNELGLVENPCRINADLAADVDVVPNIDADMFTYKLQPVYSKPPSDARAPRLEQGIPVANGQEGTKQNDQQEMTLVGQA